MASLPIISSTPIKSKLPLQSPYSIHAPSCDSAVTALAELMEPRVVGPMPVNDFLSTYFPLGEQKAAKKSAERFTLVSNASQENNAYFPFITAATALAPGLSFVDTHAHSERDSGFSFEIKPDITVYSDGRKEKHGPCETKSMEMHIEFMWQGGDPFIVPNKKTPRGEQKFVKKSAAAKEILGQITTYVAAQISAQFRTHVFSILLMRQQARILRWDREGVVVTEPINYCDDTALLDFLSYYSQASPSERGVDTTVSCAAEQEVERAREKLLLSPETQMFKTEVAGTTPKQMISLIFPASWPLSELPPSRATRGCPAYYVEEDLVVYLKDSWRIVADGIVPEGDIYVKLNEKKVPHVPVCLASGEVEAHKLQQPQTWKCSQKAWACSSGLRISVHSHYRLVLDIVGRALSEFTSTRELVQAIRDALCAHEAAWVIGILHRDVSVGNIIICNGRGFLIDWEMAKFMDSKAPHRTSRTGTWQFMSARLVADKTAEQGVADDMESAFWVLLWTALMYSSSPLPDKKLIQLINNTFDGEEGSRGKRAIFAETIFDPILFPNTPALNMLLKELSDLFKYFYDKVEESDEMILAVPSNEPVFLTHPAVRRSEARNRLQDHKYILTTFDRHLERTWPINDAARERNIQGFGLCETRRGSMRKSKRTLEAIDEDGSRKRSRVVIRKAASDNILGRHSTFSSSSSSGGEVSGSLSGSYSSSPLSE